MTIIKIECECGAINIVNKNEKIVGSTKEVSNTFLGKTVEQWDFIERDIDRTHCKRCERLLKL